MPPEAPQPPATPRKSRTGLYVGIACGCLLLIAVVIAVAGAGLWMFSRDSGEDGPTTGPSTSESSTEVPSDEPTEEPTEEPTDEVTEDPTDEPTDEPTEAPSDDSTNMAHFEAEASAPEEGTTLDTGSETMTSANGKYIGVKVLLTNTGDRGIALDLDRFTFLDVDGTEYQLMHGVFSTIGPIEPGEEASAELYADVPEDAELEAVTYNPASGPGGQSVSIPVG
ncbi:hypothetical protein CFK38_00875 [Brachybacterium vulturis]|uniref:DUF4352 domain-containing protein n=2 Tax=Brachybacterium vulturis TaxID=2017484 RepID=A0A291GJK3_9MICO|nr:hypothetical protein CFK38_00875 [Brachybacterium vulturis]